jgi:hypothetical protein
VVVGGIALSAGPVVGIVILLGTDLAPVLANIASALIYAISLPVLALVLTYLFFDAVAEEQERPPDREADAATPASQAG